MRNILNNINYKKSLFILVFNLLLITTVSYNTNIVFASIRLNPNFDKSYLSRTFYTEKVNEQVDCNQKCKIISSVNKSGSDTGWCDSGKGIGCCVQNLTLYGNSYDWIDYSTGGKVYQWYKGAWYVVTVFKDCRHNGGYCYAGDRACFCNTHAYYYYLNYYKASCSVDGNNISRSTSWKANRSNSSYGERSNAATELCNNDSNVKSAQSTCLTECKRKNDEVRIKLGSTTIEKVKDVLDTLTTEQVFYYLPHGDINSLYDPNMIYQ